MTSTKAGMVDLKCLPVYRSQDKGRYVQVYLTSRQFFWVTTPVIQPTSSSSTPARPPSTTPERLPIILPTNQFWPSAELWKTDIQGIADQFPLMEPFYNTYNVDDEGNHLSDFGKASFILNQAECFLKKCVNQIGYISSCASNWWKKLRVTK